MKTLIIGGGGYLGLTLSEIFMDRDHDVAIYDKFLYTNETFTFPHRIKIIKDDVINIENHQKTITDYDLIFYLASPRLNELKEEYQIFEPLNCLIKTLKTINKNSIFIFISSCSVYGDTNEFVNEKSQTIVTSIYSKLKIESEKIILSADNPNYKIFRLSTLYGVGRFIRNDIFINQLIDDYKKNKIIKIFDPLSNRPNLHVRDCGDILYYLTVDHLLKDGYLPKIINIGSKDLNITKRGITETIKQIVEDVVIKYIDSEDSRSYVVDFSELEKINSFLFKNYYDGIKELLTYEPVVASLENWDSIFDYYLPNGASKSWYLVESGEFDYPKTFGLWNLIDYDNNKKTFSKYRIWDSILLDFENQVHYYTQEKLINKKHLYIVNIWDCTFFIKNIKIGFKCISEKYLQDVRDNKCAIVMILQFEGYSGSSQKNNDLEIIESWIKESNLPPKNIHYIHGNLLVDEVRKQKGLQFKCHGLSIFDSWVDHRIVNEIVDYEPLNENNLFLSYNRKSRSHRIYLISQLIKNNLLNRGKVSLGQFSYDLNDVYGHKISPLEHQPFFYTYRESNPKDIHDLSLRTPIEIDRNLDVNWAPQIEIKDYKETFLSIVSETLIDDSVLFISEKIWKPIAIGHPFIILGNLGTLNYIKSLGFKTFDKWINEEYDNEPNIELRINMIVKEILKYKNKSIEELIMIRNEMKEVCLYNRNKFIEMKKEKYYCDEDSHCDNKKPILEILKDIYKNLN